jgi:hypothetical protein
MMLKIQNSDKINDGTYRWNSYRRKQVNPDSSELLADLRVLSESPRVAGGHWAS